MISNELLIGISIVMVYAGVLMATMQYLALVKFSDKRIRPPKANKVTLKQKIVNVSGNSIVALVIIFSVLYFGGEYVIYTGEVSALTVFGEALAMLLLYDFMYYFLHRGMHHPKVMKQVHGIHHYIRHPTAFESVYVHPLEGIAGNGLFMLSLCILGPISVWSFLLAFFVFTSVNILVHSNITLEGRIFKLSNYWAKRHDIHHGVHLNRNYSSIFPFWDLMFDTYA
jgi:sterol desaturase/sphingolipid hydroxylase (fatty acid hydroxylase superfamily)